MGTIQIIRMRVRRMGITGRAILPAECLSARDRGSMDGDTRTTDADFMGAADSTDAALRGVDLRVEDLTGTAVSLGMGSKGTAADSTVADRVAADAGKGRTSGK